MKYNYVVFRKNPDNKWEKDPDAGTLSFSNLAEAHEHLRGRHSLWNKLVENVTRIRKAKSGQKTTSFDYYFSYTIVWPGRKARQFREAICRA